MSKTHTAYPIVAATLAAHKYLEAVKPWGSVNEVQEIFLKYYEDMSKEIVSFKEIETKVSKLADELNAFLKDRGFTIQLNQLSPNEFGVVSILNVLVEWLETGHKNKIHVRNETTDKYEVYEAVEITAKSGGVKIFKKDSYPYPVARLSTKTDDAVYIAIADEQLEGFELAKKVESLSKDLTIDLRHNDIIFPMVTLNQQVDISWLKGMTAFTATDAWYVSQALQQTKFRMNEKGARAESAVAMVMRSCSVNPNEPITYRVNKPFYIWIERKGMSNPLFIGYITPEDWKNPGSLD